MSIVISDTTIKDGIIQQIEQTLGFPDGYIIADATRQAQWLARINKSVDKAYHIIFGADGRWQFDDANHTKYPILTGNIVSQQRDYSFTADSDGNVILDIYRVFYRKSTSDPYYELDPVDVQTDSEHKISSFTNGLNVVAHPQKYDKTSTGIFLETLPPDAVTNGLRLYVNREGSYFTASDVSTGTKMPGFAGSYHEYCVLEPAYSYARANRLDVQETLKRDIVELEEQITEFYGRRDRHQRKIMSGRITSFK